MNEINTDIDYLFGADGPLAKHFPGYKPRPSQIDYAKGIAGTLEAGDRPIITQGGTGTGKTFGYLIPSIGDLLTKGEATVEKWNEDTEECETGTRRPVGRCSRSCVQRATKSATSGTWSART